MKTSLSLMELAQEVTRQKSRTKQQQFADQNYSVKDFTAPTELLTMTDANQLDVNGELFGIDQHAHGQIASRLKIPMQYYKRMKEETPDLLSDNVNRWFKQNPEKRLVRVLDGQVRAFLSDKYRCLDNYDFLNCAMNTLEENYKGKYEVVSSNISINKMYLKVAFPELRTVVNGSQVKDDIIEAGLCLSNSEVGDGSLKVEPFTRRLVCDNGLIMNTSMKKYHIGRGSGTSYEDISELFTDETKKKSDIAIWAQVSDVIKGSLNHDVFLEQAKKFDIASTREMAAIKVPGIVERVAKEYSLNEDQGQSILGHLIKDGDLSQWGLINAVTRTATDLADYDTATTFERLGGKMLDMSESQWNKLTA